MSYKKTKKQVKQQRREFAAKRIRMGLSPADADDADDGVAYDPQLLTIARNRIFLQTFEKVTGSLHLEVDFDEFCQCLELLEITDYDQQTAKNAFKELDFENEEALKFENFIHCIYGAYPKYSLIWNELTKKKKYIHWRTIEVEGPYSEDQLKSILKSKQSAFKKKMTAIRVCSDMLADPNLKDKDTRQLLVKLLPGLLAALRDKNQYIVRCACLALADIAKSKKKNLQSQIAKILNVCWEVYDSKSELASYSVCKHIYSTAGDII